MLRITGQFHQFSASILTILIYLSVAWSLPFRLCRINLNFHRSVLVDALQWLGVNDANLTKQWGPKDPISTLSHFSQFSGGLLLKALMNDGVVLESFANGATLYPPKVYGYTLDSVLWNLVKVKVEFVSFLDPGRGFFKQ